MIYSLETVQNRMDLFSIPRNWLHTGDVATPLEMIQYGKEFLADLYGDTPINEHLYPFSYPHVDGCIEIEWDLGEKYIGLILYPDQTFDLLYGDDDIYQKTLSRSGVINKIKSILKF